MCFNLLNEITRKRDYNFDIPILKHRKIESKVWRSNYKRMVYEV